VRGGKAGAAGFERVARLLASVGKDIAQDGQDVRAQGRIACGAPGPRTKPIRSSVGGAKAGWRGAAKAGDWLMRAG
jgi:hypothetical protein